MKKIALLLAVSLLAACGGGGGGGSSSPSASGPTGTLSVNVTKAAALTTPTQTDTTRTMRRIVITNPTSGLSGIVWTNPDYELAPNAQTAPTYTLPVATGYQIEVFEYKIPQVTFSSYSIGTSVRAPRTVVSTPYQYYRYGTATFDIAAGSNSVTVSPAAVAAPTVTAPTTIVGQITQSPASTFNISSNLSGASAVYSKSSWGIFGKYSAGALNNLRYSTTDTATGVAAPRSYEGSILKTSYYMAAQYGLKTSLSKSDDGDNFKVFSPFAKATLTTTTGTIAP